MRSETPIYTKRVWIDGARREVFMTAKQLEAAISNWAEMETAFAAFLFHVERVRAASIKHVSIDGFETGLVRTTQKATGQGSLLRYQVWEELLNRHGIPTNWNRDDVYRSRA